MDIFKKRLKHHCFIIYIFLNLLNFILSEDCPREKPILKSSECQAIYCTPEEYSSNVCKISNKYTEIQWLNNFHFFSKGYMSHISVTQNYKGELFLSSQKSEDDYDKYLFGFNSEGEGLFYDKEKDKYNSFEIIDFEIREFADYNNYVEIDGKGYLIGVPTEDDIYLIDYLNNTIKSFSIIPIAKGADTIFKINSFDDLFFTAYTFCTDTFGKNCSLYFQSFKLNLTKLEKIKNITNIPTALGTRINCFQNIKNYIICFYSIKIGDTIIDEFESIPILEHYISVINPITFKFEDTILLENNYTARRMFDETMHLKNNLYILGYAIDDEVIKIQFKNIEIIENLDKSAIVYTDYFANIEEIFINKDRKYDLDHGSFKRNSFCKINDNKFAMFLKDYSKDFFKSTNSILLIFIFTLFNNDKNINIRKYSIDFELYNRHTNDDIKGFTLGNFFGVVLGLTKDIETYQTSTAFLTFGYVNSTDQENIDTKLKYNNTNSKIVINDYINDIENNLFGYTFLGVKIISIPSEIDSGFFINLIDNEKIKVNDIIPKNSELKFILNENFKVGIYSIQFAGIVKEPDYETMNEFAEEIICYPDNDTSEKDFYEPKILLGKKMNFKFRLSNCYDSCATCTEFSEDENDHKCIKCRDGFYFKKDTNNCYNKINEKYYFDEVEQIFLPCYKDCLTCSTKENNSKNMNCLSCENNFKFYNKSKNCMICPNYINFEQNECIDKIPNGYYLEDEDLGTLGVCHYLCETCSKGSSIVYGKLHMNCDICLYQNKNFRPIYDGDCPDSPDIIDPDYPVDGKCPKNKPILKNGKCQLIFCTDDEYLNSICQIYNPIVKEQWLNKFNIFSELNNSAISLSIDIISNEKIIFLSQNIDKDEEYKEKYIYGFYKNGTGLFYNKNKNIFESLKKMNFSDNKLIDKIGYLEMDYTGYILTTPINNYLYLIDYEDNKIMKKEIDTPAFSTDRIILMQEEDEASDPDYTISYIYCKDLINLNDCYLMMKNFEADQEILEENLSMKPDIKIHYNSQLNCYKDERNYIRCIYTKYGENSNYKHILGIISTASFSLVKEFELENNYDLEPTFDSMIQLKSNIFIIAYSLPNNKNIIKILIKKIDSNFIMNDYIESIPEILLNEDKLYKFEGAKASGNSLVKISYDKFSLLVNNFNNNNLNSEIVIFILTIYESYSKINIRHYIINLSLYNTFINEKIIGYNFNGFFGALIELASPENNNLKRAAFLTFGYINSTQDIDPMEGNEILIVKREKIKIYNYLNTIENNIFGYVFSGIQIISVPDEKVSGQFTLNTQYYILKENDIISTSSEISFTLCDNPKTGNYSIIFAPIIKEPNYDIMKSYCDKIETYPKNETDTESKFYLPGEFLGKYFSFNFYIKGDKDCYQNCETCYWESKDVNNQLCIKCKDGYYKINGTNNCFLTMSSGYYFDENQKLFMPCYKDCLSCNDSGTELKMNCMTCDDDLFDYYKKSTNCLDCPKYVDYAQSKCINEIPEGYFLDNDYLGTIDKCHELCKTCEKKSVVENGQLYMNCKTCKYNNSKKILMPGNCPETQEEEDENKNKENKNDKEKNEKEGSKTLTWVLSLSIIIIFLIIIGIIIYKKFYNQNINDRQNDYKSLKGHNIKLEDEPIYGIN